MVLQAPLAGERVILRSAEERDAEFTRMIRRDPQLTKYIPVINGTLEDQIAWLRRQREKEDDYFFVVEERGGKSIGTISCYDIDEQAAICEIGRYISYGNALENVEAALLLLDFVFNSIHMKSVIMNCDERNQAIINFWIRMGAVFAEKISMGAWTAAQYRLTAEGYEKRRPGIMKLIKK